MKRLLIPIILMVAAALAQWSIPPYNLVVSGGVTAVRAGYGLTFSESPLVDTGTIIWDSTGFKAWYNAGTTADSITKLVGKFTRVRSATVYTTNIFPTATTTHLLFALTASTSLDSVRFKATVVRGDSSSWTAVTATNFRGALTGKSTTSALADSAIALRTKAATSALADSAIAWRGGASVDSIVHLVSLPLIGTLLYMHDSLTAPAHTVLCNGTLKFKDAAGDSVVTKDYRNVVLVGSDGDTLGHPATHIEGGKALTTGGAITYTPVGAVNAHSVTSGSDFVAVPGSGAYSTHTFTGTADTLVPPYRAVKVYVWSRWW